MCDLLSVWPFYSTTSRCVRCRNNRWESIYMLRLETGLRFVFGNTRCLTTRVYILVEKWNHKRYFYFSGANVPGNLHSPTAVPKPPLDYWDYWHAIPAIKKKKIILPTLGRPVQTILPRPNNYYNVPGFCKTVDRVLTTHPVQTVIKLRFVTNFGFIC